MAMNFIWFLGKSKAEGGSLKQYPLDRRMIRSRRLFPRLFYFAWIMSTIHGISARLLFNAAYLLTIFLFPFLRNPPGVIFVAGINRDVSRSRQ
jgi:hypothetical protein